MMPVSSIIMRSVVSIAGVPVALEAKDSRRWSAMMAVFANCRTTTDAATLTVSFHVEQPTLPPEQPHHRVTDLDLWYERGFVAFRHESGVCGRTDDDVIDVGGGEDEQSLDRGFRVVVQYALIECLARRGIHALHAAVVERDNCGLLVIGGMGSGKSTLCYAAAGAGWNVLTDDIAWIVSSDPLLIGGLPKPLKVPGDTLQHPPPGASVLVGDARSRIVMPAEFVRSHGPVGLRVVVFVDHSDGDGRIERLPSGPRLVGEIMRIFPLAHMRAHHRSFFPAAVRIGQLPALGLLHDADAGRRVEVAARLLDQASAVLGDGLATQ
jgi:hypothetical protein